MKECLIYIFSFCMRGFLLHAKTAGGGGPFGPPPPTLCGFPENVSSKERVKSCFFVTINTILKHIFPENFIEFPEIV